VVVEALLDFRPRLVDICRRCSFWQISKNESKLLHMKKDVQMTNAAVYVELCCIQDTAVFYPLHIWTPFPPKRLSYLPGVPQKHT
jgi:hypothetical protein